MSQLFFRDDAKDWQVIALSNACVELRSSNPVSRATPQAADPARPVLLRLSEPPRDERWTLLCAPVGQVQVNGAPVPTGIRLLADRDSIDLGNGHTLFFSAEKIAEIVPFPNDVPDACCARCKLPIEPGSPAVRCPASECRVWHHASEEKTHCCWTYADTCALCGHPTDMDAGLQWSPADL